MANGPAFEHAVNLHRLNPTLDIGIHLTLVEESPLLQTDQIRSLVNGNGEFYQHTLVFLKKYFRKKINLQEIKQELEAQINKVMDHGITISHIDSHQHLHMLPGIISIVLGFMKKYKIPAVRLPREKINFKTIISGVSLLRVIQLRGLNFLCSKIKNRSILCTDHFAGFLYGGYLHKKKFEKLLNALPQHSTCEIMCYPGMNNEDADYNHWQYRWADELAVLTDQNISNLIQQKRFQLISYQDLSIK